MRQPWTACCGRFGYPQGRRPSTQSPGTTALKALVPVREFGAVVNDSLTQTVARSLSTSLTLVFTAVALLLFGGVTIRNFLLAMLIDIISGTYSSIFIASQLLVMWENGELNPGKLFRRVSERQEHARQET